MYQPIKPGFARQSRQPCGGLDMRGMKGVLAALDVEANAIHDGIGPRQGCDDLSLVLHIGSQRCQSSGIRLEHRGGPLRVPRCCPDLEIMIEQVPYDPAAEEAGSTEDRDQPSMSVPSRALIPCH